MVSLKSSSIIDHCYLFFKDLPYRKFILAYSGGMDSSCLFDCLLKVKKKLDLSFRTIHINHNLNNHSSIYQEHCQSFAKKNNVEHISYNVYLDNMSNIEEQCRDLRYKKLSSSCKEDEAIILAHHLDDQIETFVLRMMRGASIKGMSVMSKSTLINEKIFLRPLLDISKDIITAYTKKNSLSYIEDITNDDIKFDRNFIRRKVLPTLKERWSSLEKNIFNNISIFSIQNDFIEKQAQIILKLCCPSTNSELSIEALKKYDHSIQVIIIHIWVYEHNKTILNLKHIDEIMKFLYIKNDKNPLFKFNGFNITKKNNFLIITTQ